MKQFHSKSFGFDKLNVYNVAKSDKANPDVSSNQVSNNSDMFTNKTAIEIRASKEPIRIWF